MEVFKNILWFEGKYQISNLWNVKSLDYRNTGKETILKNRKHKNWYFNISLSKNWKSKNYFIHRLVAEVFIENPENKRTVNHKNGIKIDNKLENLEWMTDKENINHSINILWNEPKIWKIWLYNHRSRKIKQFDRQNNFIKNFDTIEAAAKELKVFSQSIIAVCRGRQKTAWGFIFKYN